MKVSRFASLCILAISLGSTVVQADIVSNVWSTGVAGRSNGAFGTPGSVSANTVSATITSGATVANVSLTADNSVWFRTSGSPIVNNDQLAPFLENDSPLTTLTFSSDRTLNDFDILVHNIWFAPDGNRNYIGNFQVTYGNGVVVNNATPTIRGIATNSPFAVDFLGGTTQPTGLADVFDGYNLATMSGSAFDPGNGAPLGTYLFDGTRSIGSEEQGSAVLSFDETLFGGIKEVKFSWVGHTIGTNTAFIGFAGKVVSVPEPSSCVVLAALGVGLCTLRRRRKISECTT